MGALWTRKLNGSIIVFMLPSSITPEFFLSQNSKQNQMKSKVCVLGSIMLRKKKVLNRRNEYI